MQIIVGLGNPGKEYEHTRHNAGFDALDKLADKYSITIKTTKLNANNVGKDAFKNCTH